MFLLLLLLLSLNAYAAIEVSVFDLGKVQSGALRRLFFCGVCRRMKSINLKDYF